MRLSATAVFGLVLLVSFAGCNAIPGTSTNQSTFAPGVSDERVTNASTLDAANRAILQNTSYTYVSNYSQRIDSDGYQYAVDHDVRVQVDDGSFLYDHHGNFTGSERASEYIDGVWANESVAVMQTVNVSNESVRYTRYRPPEPYPASNTTRSGISETLKKANVTQRWNDSGTGYVRVQVDESETRRWQAPNGSVVNITTVHAATATVREDGFVPSINASVSGHRPLPAGVNGAAEPDGGSLARIQDTTRIRYKDLGSTKVPRPEWVDEGLNATDGMPLGQTTRSQPVNLSSS